MGSFDRIVPRLALRRLYETLLLLLLHLLIQALRRTLAPGFPASTQVLSTVAGALLETAGAWLLLRLAMDYRFEGKRLVPDRLDRSLATGLVLGAGLGILFFGALFVVDALFRLPVRGAADISYWRQGLLVPAVEELYFRFFLMGAMLQRGWTMKWAIPFSALIFALSHDYFVAPFLFPVGLAAGWLFGRHGAWSSFLMHATYNLLIVFQTLR